MLHNGVSDLLTYSLMCFLLRVNGAFEKAVHVFLINIRLFIPYCTKYVVCKIYLYL
jgi:hypothetical protein